MPPDDDNDDEEEEEVVLTGAEEYSEMSSPIVTEMEEDHTGKKQGLTDRKGLEILEDFDTRSINDEVERMLDFFPLHLEELLHVLEASGKYSEIVGSDESSGGLLSFLFESSVLSVASEPSADTVDFCEKRRYVEKEFLAETPLILAVALEMVFLFGSGHDDSSTYRFLEAIATLLGRRGSRSVLTILFRVAVTASGTPPEEKKENGSPSTHTGSPPTAKVEELVSLTYRLVLAWSYLLHGRPTLTRQHPREWVKSLAERSTENCSGETVVSLSVWMDWVQSVAPQIGRSLTTFCHVAIFGAQHPFRVNNPPLSPPSVLNQDTKSALWTFPYQSVPASLTVLSTALGGPWIQLYSSDSDGFSFRAMQEALLSYCGTTVLLIQTTAGDSFGYYSNCPWKESRRWYGEHEATESFLFGLKPALQYFAPASTSRKPYYMFLHNPAYAHATDLNGLAIGGINDKTPRVHITTTFERCKAGSIDAVYASGPLLSDGEIFFDIDVVELYAVNCTADEFEAGLSKGIANAAIREGTRLKAALVDRKQFLEDFQTGQFMNQAFVHRDQIRGRHSFVAHEDASSGYFIDSKSPSKRHILDDDDEERRN
ncbi:TLD domain containing protein [Nitzschia inconspicua]|uniref:Oxidation resistance protein 1 n=1 Tax=Nitzschia inconspicua TaxID=303405 RepID=A0A9K3LF20_9STRA|nr:TLD domain containing protein [Nitzschia inconspicua]